MVATVYCARVCRRTTVKVNVVSKQNPKGLKQIRKKKGRQEGEKKKTEVNDISCKQKKTNE